MPTSTSSSGHGEGYRSGQRKADQSKKTLQGSALRQDVHQPPGQASGRFAVFLWLDPMSFRATHTFVVVVEPSATLNIKFLPHAIEFMGDPCVLT
jgi:hypothetical protein